MMPSEDEAYHNWAGPGAWVYFVKYLNLSLMFLICVWIVMCEPVWILPFELSVHGVQVLYVYLQI
jgi:hypothetical protein